MAMLYVQAAEFHQLPSSILIPNAPRYLRWWLDGAVLIWQRERDRAGPETPASSTSSNAAGLPAVGTVTGQRVEFNGKAIPWLEQDAQGRWRHVQRN